MKKIKLIMVLVFLGWCIASAQDVNVTFRVNAAAVPDTMDSGSVIQIRGTLITPAGRTADDASADTLAPGVILTWNGYSTLLLDYVDGDYWEATFPIPAGSQLAYKFWTNSMYDTVYGGADYENKGWESSIEKLDYVYGTDRGLDLSTFAGTDTTLPIQFVNGQLAIAEQYFRPYVESDSIDVWFRVNMQTYEELNAATQVVGVRGGSGGADIGDLSWDRTFNLTQESRHANTGSRTYNGEHFWSGRVRIPSDVDPGTSIEYKFVVMNQSDPSDAEPLKEEEIENRSFTIASAQSDTTLHWVWFDNIVPPPIVHNDRVKITFLADMSKAIQNHGFSFGDTVEVRVGYFLTAREIVTAQLKRQGFSTFYQGSVNVYTTFGQNIDYQYYTIKLATDYRENYYNFRYEGDNLSEAERRQFLVLDTPITVADTLSSQVEQRRMPVFRNVSIVSQNVLVTYMCDLRPAYYTVLAGSTLVDIQGTTTITDPEQVLTLGLAMNGPATGSWSNSIGPDWGPHLLTLENKLMYDDGTHGDEVANDTIYAIQFTYYPDSADVVGEEFKFGIGGGDNEGGYGNNHIENIDDSQSESIIYSQFGSIDPLFYSAWDYDKQQKTDVSQSNLISPYQFSLERNYPNPFNPITKIRYQLAKSVKVNLSVYNILGEKVISLVDAKQNAGKHEVSWNGRDINGRLVGSGLYFYRIEADDFIKTYKMMLLK